MTANPCQNKQNILYVIVKGGHYANHFSGRCHPNGILQAENYKCQDSGLVMLELKITHMA